MTQTLTPPALAFIETEIARQEERLAALERQRDAALAQRQTAIVEASQAQDAIASQERLRAGISADEPKSPFRQAGVFIESFGGVREAMARQRGGPHLAAAQASGTAFQVTQRLNGLAVLIGTVRRELAQLQREEEAALHAAGQPSRGWKSPALPTLSEPAGGIG
jgi:hypothetical protein